MNLGMKFNSFVLNVRKGLPNSSRKVRKSSKIKRADEQSYVRGFDRWQKFEDDVKEALPKHEKRDTPFEENTKIMVEIATRERKDSFEFAQLTKEQKTKVLTEIDAPSEWAAYYDFQAYPPNEVYNDNEEFFHKVPYFKDAIDLRGEMSVGVGFTITDKETQEVSEQEKFLREVYKRLKIQDKMMKTQKHRDLYGNGYWHLVWSGKDLIKIIIIQSPKMRIRLSKDGKNRIIGYVYIPPQLVVGTPPLPVPLGMNDVIHFVGDDYDDTPYGYSKVWGIEEVLRARWDINILLPIFFKHYAKPWIHWKMERAGLTPTQIKARVDEMFSLMEEVGPDSDMITDDRWSPSAFSAGNMQQNPQLLIDDLDNQIFGQVKVPETYFKSKGMTDRMILKGDDNFTKEMKRIQNDFSWNLSKLNKMLLEKRFGPREQIKNSKTGESEWSYEIPQVVWNDVFEEQITEKSNRSVNEFNAGLIMLNEARKNLDKPPLEDEEIQEMQQERFGGMVNEQQPTTAPSPEKAELSIIEEVVEDAEVKVVLRKEVK